MRWFTKTALSLGLVVLLGLLQESESIGGVDNPFDPPPVETGCTFNSLDVDEGEVFLNTQCNKRLECRDGEIEELEAVQCGQNARCDVDSVTQMGSCVCNLEFVGDPLDKCEKLNTDRCHSPFKLVKGNCILGPSDRKSKADADNMCRDQYGARLYRLPTMETAKQVLGTQGLPNLKNKWIWISGIADLAKGNIVNEVMKNYGEFAAAMKAAPRTSAQSTKGRKGINSKQTKSTRTSFAKGISSFYKSRYSQYKKSSSSNSAKGDKGNKGNKGSLWKASNWSSNKLSNWKASSFSSSRNSKSSKSNRYSSARTSYNSRWSNTKSNKGNSNKRVKRTVRTRTYQYDRNSCYGRLLLNLKQRYSTRMNSQSVYILSRRYSGAQTSPKTSSSTTKCIAMKVSSTYNVDFQFLPCSQKLNYICQKFSSLSTQNTYTTDWLNSGTLNGKERESANNLASIPRFTSGPRPACADPISMRCRIVGTQKEITPTNKQGYILASACENNLFLCMDSANGNGNECPDVEVKLTCPGDANECAVEANRQKCESSGMLCANSPNGGHRCLGQCRSDNYVCFDSCEEGATCSSTGDPHLKTFDQKKYNFQGDCTYIMMEPKSSLPSVPYFRIIADFYKKNPSSKVSYTRWVELRYNGHEYRLHNGELFVDGSSTAEVLPIDQSGVKAFMCGQSLVLTTDIGIQIRTPKEHRYYITASKSKLNNKVQGLCSNFDGDSDDDLTFFGDAAVVSSQSQANRFGDSWALPSVGSNCPPQSSAVEVRCPADKERQLRNSDAKCGFLFSSTSPFRKGKSQSLLGEIDDIGEKCVYDLCLGSDTFDRCDYLQMANEALAKSDKGVDNWRALTSCSLSCKGDLVPLANQPLYEKTCNSPAVFPTLMEKEEMCRCPNGLVRSSGDRCVEENDCGCKYNTRHIDVGSSIMVSGCTRVSCELNNAGIPTPSFNTMTCVENADCQGSRCVCRDGYKGDGTKQCFRSATSITCPPNWQQKGSKCYQLVSKKLTWQKAAEKCADLIDGGQLARIDAESERVGLTEFANSQTGLTLFWMSGNLEVLSPRSDPVLLSQLDVSQAILNLNGNGCTYGRLKDNAPPTTTGKLTYNTIRFGKRETNISTSTGNILKGLSSIWQKYRSSSNRFRMTKSGLGGIKTSARSTGKGSKGKGTKSSNTLSRFSGRLSSLYRKSSKGKGSKSSNTLPRLSERLSSLYRKSSKGKGSKGKGSTGPKTSFRGSIRTSARSSAKGINKGTKSSKSSPQSSHRFSNSNNKFKISRSSVPLVKQTNKGKGSSKAKGKKAPGRGRRSTHRSKKGSKGKGSKGKGSKGKGAKSSNTLPRLSERVSNLSRKGSKGKGSKGKGSKGKGAKSSNTLPRLSERVSNLSRKGSKGKGSKGKGSKGKGAKSSNILPRLSERVSNLSRKGSKGKGSKGKGSKGKGAKSSNTLPRFSGRLSNFYRKGNKGKGPKGPKSSQRTSSNGSPLRNIPTIGGRVGRVISTRLLMIQVDVTQHCHHTKQAICEYDPVKFNERKIVKVYGGKPKKSGNEYKLSAVQAILSGRPVCKKPFGVTYEPAEAAQDTITTPNNNQFICKGPTCKNYKVFFQCRQDVNECSNDVAGSNACPGGMQCVDTYGHFVCQCPPNTGWDHDERKCIAVNQCKCTGDPHCTGYTDKKNDFQGKCKYLISGVCETGMGIANLNIFKVECKFTKCGKPEKRVTCTKFCDVTIFKNQGSFTGDKTVIRLGRSGKVQINGNELSGNSYSQDGIQVSKSGKESSILTDFDLSAKFDGRSKIFLNVPDTYIGKMCGICGDIGVSLLQSFRLPDGTLFTPEFRTGKKSNRFTKESGDEFGNAWEVNDPEDSSCTNSPSGEAECTSTQETIVEEACNNLMKVQTAFQTMAVDQIPMTDYDDAFNECMQDGCAYTTDELPEMVCSKAEILAEALNKRTAITTANWRSSEFCDLGCAADEVTAYFAKCDKECGMDTLTDAATCNGVPNDRCVCKGNLFRLGTECVERGNCGCDMDPGTSGKTFRLDVGETSLDADCKNEVTCGVNGKITVVSKVTLDPNSKCDTSGNRPSLTCISGFGKQNGVCVDQRDCGGDFARINGACISDPVVEESWREAIQTCSFQGARFIQLLSQQDVDEFKELVNGAAAGIEYYIAGLNINSLDKMRFAEPGYENYRFPFGIEQSDSVPSTASYQCYTYDSVNGIQAQTDCEKKRPFFCEKILPEEKTVDFGPCSGAEPMANGREVETITGIIESNPTCMCPEPMDITCSPDSNTFAVCSATPSGVLSECNSNCADTEISGKCEPNVNECASGWNLCPAGTNCEDRWGSFQCVCPSSQIKVDGVCQAVQSCRLSFIPVMGQDPEVKLTNFQSTPFADEIDDCQLNLVVDCASTGTSLFWVKNGQTNEQFINVVFPAFDVKITAGSTKPTVTVNGQSPSTVNYSGFTIAEGAMNVVVATNDRRLLVNIGRDLTTNLQTAYTCGACAETTESDVFSGCTLSTGGSPGGNSGGSSDGPSGAEPPSGTPPPPPSGTPPPPPPPPNGTPPPPSGTSAPPPPPPNGTPPPPPSGTSPPPPPPPNGTPPPPPSGTSPPPPSGTPPSGNPGTPPNTPFPEPPPPPVTQKPQPPPPVTTPPPSAMSSPAGPGASVPLPVTMPPPPTTPPPTPPSNPMDTCMQLMAEDTQCGYITLSGSPFASCSNSPELEAMCIEQICNNDLEICEAFDMAVAGCAGSLSVQNRVDFRMATGCVPDCPENMEFSIRPPSVAATCLNRKPNLANEGGIPPSEPMCVCATGFLLQNGVCVLSSQCGCKDPNSNRYYEDQEVWYNDDCSKRYTCDGGEAVAKGYTIPQNAICSEENNKPVVVCAPGYLGDPAIECKIGEDDGSGLCAVVYDGYDNIRKCVCNTGFVSDCETCVDLDECQTNNHECKSNEKCVNTRGSYNCDCKPGYERSLLGVCKNINECQLSAERAVCPSNSKCEDIPGSYICRCCLGYRAQLTLHGIECIPDNRFQVAGKDCCLCTTSQCKPPTNGSPAKVCGSDGVTYRNYKELYETNCLRYGENNINVTVVNYGACRNSQTTRAPPTTTAAPTTEDECNGIDICSVDEINSGGCCSGGQDFTNLCDLRVHYCRTGRGSSTLPPFTRGVCRPVPPTTTTPEPTPSPNDFTQWGPWSICRPRPGGISCGTSMGVRFRTRDYTGPDSFVITSEMVRQEDSCDLATCATESENPIITCNYNGCPKHDERFCGRIVGLDAGPVNYESRCHLERAAECNGKHVSLHRNEYYPGQCSPDGKRPSSFPCSRGPFVTTARYTTQSAKTGQSCTSEVFPVADCNEGVCDAGSGSDVCCKPDKIDIRKVDVVCTNSVGLKQTIVKEVLTVVSCKCGQRDDDGV